MKFKGRGGAQELFEGRMWDGSAANIYANDVNIEINA